MLVVVKLRNWRRMRSWSTKRSVITSGTYARRSPTSWRPSNSLSRKVRWVAFLGRRTSIGHHGPNPLHLLLSRSMVMRQSFDIRLGVAEDAGRLAVLAIQVWLHTYATDGISTEIADYVLAHITPKTYAQLLRDGSTQVLVALHANHVVGLAVVRFDMPCPDQPALTAELRTLYVQEHFLRQGA